MENEQDVQEVQETPEETQDDTVMVSTAELEELRKKASASEQNFARLKKEEERRKELEANLPKGESKEFDSAALKREIEDRVSVRLSGHSPEEVEEIEAYAKGKGISLSEAAKSPFVKKAVEAIRAEKKSTESTPAPSSNIRTFGGKPLADVLREGTDSDKQNAFETIMKGGVKNND